MKTLRFVFATIFVLMMGFDQLTAQIPRTLSYQGVLTDAAGKPRPNSSYQFTFRLYDVATGSTALWTEQKILLVTNGLFATALGDQVAFGAAVKFDRQYWLGIQVQGEQNELSPRIALTSVGYSMNSLRADTAKVAVASLTDSTWKHDSENIYRLNGKVGIGTATPSTHLNIDPQGEGFILIGNPNTSTGGFTSLLMGISAARDGYGEIQAIRRSGSAYGDLALNPRGGVVGIGGELVWGNNSALHRDQGGSIELGGDAVTGARTPYIDFHSPGGASDYNVRIINDANGQLSFKAQKVVASGRTVTCVLEITGGCDLAEPFPTSEAEGLPPGAVVVIDENNPGHLKLSRKTYDKGVAGIVSGAGGINPGLTLRQEGVMEGEQNIALTGRVYALATAANGPIKPGDRLTTSALPGHCMKATDSLLCDGAVIGKAMSSLETGEGLVLVLVNLQ